MISSWSLGALLHFLLGWVGLGCLLVSSKSPAGRGGRPGRTVVVAAMVVMAVVVLDHCLDLCCHNRFALCCRAAVLRQAIGMHCEPEL